MAGSNIVEKKDLDKLKKFSQFLSENGEVYNFSRNVLNFIRDRVEDGSIPRELGTLNQLLGSESKEWYADLIAAVINASLTVEHHQKFLEDRLELDGEDINKNLGVERSGVYGSTLPGGEFAFDLKFKQIESNVGVVGRDEFALARLLEILYHGGEFVHKETDKKNGEEETTYEFNAVRGFYITQQIESMISTSMKAYFAKNVKNINDELQQKFEEWKKSKGIR
jgi:hypothetical protein